MHFFDAVSSFGGHSFAREYVISFCNSHSIQWTRSADVVFYFSCLQDFSPTFRGKAYTKEELMHKWVNAYFGDLNARPSVRVSNPPQTAHDLALDTIIKGRLTQISDLDLETIKWAHRLSMSAENIFGLILEEYLSERLLPFNWHCAWGSVVKAVDFVCEDGRLLQVKSRNNTENSSSNKVRTGTEIQKWWRFNASNGFTNWSELNRIIGCNLSEEDFLSYIVNLIRRNPNALAIERDNTLISFS